MVPPSCLVWSPLPLVDCWDPLKAQDVVAVDGGRASLAYPH